MQITTILYSPLVWAAGKVKSSFTVNQETVAQVACNCIHAGGLARLDHSCDPKINAQVVPIPLEKAAEYKAIALKIPPFIDVCKANGTHYIGHFLFENETWQGEGKVIFANKDIHEGIFVDGLLEGEGKKLQANGTCYVGVFKEGRLNGRGSKILVDGSIFEGEFENDCLNGIGRKTIGKDIYEGHFKDDLLMGVGCKTFGLQQITYYGQFTADKLNGTGEIDIADKLICRGRFKDDKPLSVFSIVHASDPTVVFQGIFQYEEILNGSITGRGKKILIDQTVYEGYFEKGELKGYAKIIWADNSSVEGNFQNGAINGEGTYTSSAGLVRKGLIANNRLVYNQRLKV
jgi:hypothetical protein